MWQQYQIINIERQIYAALKYVKGRTGAYHALHFNILVQMWLTN